MTIYGSYCNIDINEWGGRESVQLIVRDIKPSKQQLSVFKQERERFEEIKNGATFSAEEDILPSRSDFAAVYKLMLSSYRSGIDTLSHRDIICRMKNPEEGINIGYIKLKIIIMVFKELNILSIEDVGEEVYKFKIHYSSTKTMLDKSTLLRRIRSQMHRND